MKSRSAFDVFSVIQLVLSVLLIVGYVKCVIKFVSCDFEATYKAEVIYGVGCVTGLGGVIGWFDIKD